MAQDAALFITCLSDQFYPRVGLAITRVLEHLGWRIHFPAEQTCCGQPLLNSGMQVQAKASARRMIQIFEPYEYIVTPSASCCATVRQYPQLLAGEAAWAGGAAKLAGRTYEFVEFLDRVLHADLSGLSLPRKTPLTYHYTCHQRAIGLGDAAQRLLQQIGNIDYRPLDRMEQCCGFGGMFAVKFPTVSGAIAEDKARAIAATGAGTVVCNEGGCALNISGSCHRLGIDVRVRHFAEVLAEAIGLDLERWQ